MRSSTLSRSPPPPPWGLGPARPVFRRCWSIRRTYDRFTPNRRATSRCEISPPCAAPTTRPGPPDRLSWNPPEPARHAISTQQPSSASAGREQTAATGERPCSKTLECARVDQRASESEAPPNRERASPHLPEAISRPAASERTDRAARDEIGATDGGPRPKRTAPPTRSAEVPSLGSSTTSPPFGSRAGGPSRPMADGRFRRPSPQQHATAPASPGAPSRRDRSMRRPPSAFEADGSGSERAAGAGRCRRSHLRTAEFPAESRHRPPGKV